MKRWAVLVVLIYFLALLALTGPLFVFLFYPHIGAHDLADLFSEWGYWAWMGVMLAGQAVLLLVPVNMAMGRPTTRRWVLWPVLASGLMAGVLAMGAVLSIFEFVKKDKALDVMDGSELHWLVIVLVVWAAWGLVFYRTSRGTAAEDVVSRQCRYLLRGSILELLVAVPTHIVARYRDYCCAGVYTFVGISCGVSVMLFSFGPAVFFLFVQRWKQLHPQPRPAPG